MIRKIMAMLILTGVLFAFCGCSETATEGMSETALSTSNATTNTQTTSTVPSVALTSRLTTKSSSASTKATTLDTTKTNETVKTTLVTQRQPSPHLEYSTMKVVVEGRPLEYCAIETEDGTYVGFFAVLEAVGYDVTWKSHSQAIIHTPNDGRYLLDIEEPGLYGIDSGVPNMNHISLEETYFGGPPPDRMVAVWDGDEFFLYWNQFLHFTYIDLDGRWDIESQTLSIKKWEDE